MQCQNCGTSNSDRQKFCTACGSSLLLLCPRCKTEVMGTHKFCGECGLKLNGTTALTNSAQIEYEGERKHVTVLFSDISGYTNLTDTHDPEEVREITSQIFAEITSIVSEYRGFIEKFIGDAVLAIFGLPAVHEDDPVRAVSAALNIHRTVQSIRLNVNAATGHALRMHSGIHTGLVVTGEANLEKGIHGIVGNTLNLASRLADLAQPGEILVSPQTHRLIAAYFKTQPLPSVSLKGIAQRVKSFRIVGELGVRSRFEASKREGFSAFTGRTQELNKLHSCLDTVLSGRGQIVTITAEAGMGKSRLTYEFCQSIDRQNVTLLLGRCQAYGSNTPYLPILNALRNYLLPKEEHDHEQQEQRVVAMILSIDPTLELYLPVYLHLLSIPSRSYPLPDGLVGQKLKNSINQALAALLLVNAQRKPTVLVLDDWHWVDEASEASLLHLVGLMEKFPLMLMITYRPERTAGWPDWHFRSSFVLKALDRRCVEQIIQSNWKADALPEGFADFIHDHTGGNPLFVEEVCRSLTEEGSVLITGRQAVLINPAEHLKLPVTVQAVIRSRLDRLDIHVKETLQLAAVIGRQFPLRILEQLTNDRNPLPVALTLLQSQGLIQQTGMVSETEYKFKHALTQLTVYESLLIKKRRKVHADIGRILEQLYAGHIEKQYEDLAYHYSHSTDTVKALFYLEMAGSKAARVHSLAEARRYFETALEICGRQPVDRQDQKLYVDLALKWAEVSQFAPSNKIRNTLIQSLEYSHATGSKTLIAKASYWVGKFGYMQGDFVDAIPRIKESQRLAENLRDKKLLALSTTLYGRSCLYTCDYLKGIQYLNSGLNLADVFDAWDDTVYSTAIQGMMLGLTGDFKGSLKTIAKAIHIARRYEIPTFEAMAFGYLGAVQYWYGNWRATINNCNKCISVSQRLGNPLPINWATMFRGAALFNSGDRGEGLRIMGRSIEMMTSLDSVLALRFFFALYSEKLAISGRYHEAESTVKKAMALSQSGQKWGDIPAYRTLAILSAVDQTPDWRQVDMLMKDSIDLAQRTKAAPEMIQNMQCYAGLMQRKGDESGAQEYFRQAREIATRIGYRTDSLNYSEKASQDKHTLAVGCC